MGGQSQLFVYKSFVYKTGKTLSTLLFAYAVGFGGDQPKIDVVMLL